MSDKDLSNKGQKVAPVKKSLTGFEALKPKPIIPTAPNQGGSPSNTGGNKTKDK